MPGVDVDPFGHDEPDDEDAQAQHVDATGHDDRRA
jgi:hypothetical protein